MEQKQTTNWQIIIKEMIPALQNTHQHTQPHTQPRSPSSLDLTGAQWHNSNLLEYDQPIRGSVTPQYWSTSTIIENGILPHKKYQLLQAR